MKSNEFFPSSEAVWKAGMGVLVAYLLSIYLVHRQAYPSKRSGYKSCGKRKHSRGGKRKSRRHHHEGYENFEWDAETSQDPRFLNYNEGFADASHSSARSGNVTGNPYGEGYAVASGLARPECAPAPEQPAKLKAYSG